MITRLDGTLVAVAKGRAHLQCGPVTYELMVPAADEQRLAGFVGDDITIDTLHYLEAQGQGSSMIPRLIGFASIEDRAFFELFTTVKGMGSKKALRALALPFPRIAEAIANRDVDMLKSLPEIGKRTAETIVAELSGKVDGFIELKPGAGSESPIDDTHRTMAADVVKVLTELGENRPAALNLVERALAADREIESPEALLQAALRLRDL